MKTIPLEEALQLAAPRPLTPKKHGQILTSRAEQIAVVTDRLQIEAGSTIGNAALLAHFYNHGPELVEVLDALLKSFVTKESYPEFESGSENSRFIELATWETKARALLAKASTVQMP